MLSIQRLLFGPLRRNEIEQLYEKGWFAITETALAMTIFREEVGVWFIIMFVGLLAGKVWGWLCEGRLEILQQQPPANPILFHGRLATSLLISLGFASFMLNNCLTTVFSESELNMMVMFLFEYFILFIISLSTACRYMIALAEIHIVEKLTLERIHERKLEIQAERMNAASQSTAGSATDSQPAPTTLASEIEVDETEIEPAVWEGKSIWIFYLDIGTETSKLAVYCMFFWLMVNQYGIPIHIIRDIVMTSRNLFKRLADFARYMKATRDMEQKYPDATPEQIQHEEVCIICRDEMRPPRPRGQNLGGAGTRSRATDADQLSRPKRLPCGHVLHFGCLRSWLERQQVCPTCRRSVITTTPIVRGGGGEPAPVVAPAPRPQGRGRVFHLGPLRIGFGAGDENFVQNIANEVRGDPVPPPDLPPPGRGEIRRGFTFGFGIPGLRRRRNDEGAPAPALTARARHAEHPETSHQVLTAHVRYLQDQVTMETRRLIAARENIEEIQRQVEQLGRTLSSLRSGSPAQTSPPATAGTTSQDTVVPGRTVSPNPSPALQGVVLPPGWTLLPLTRTHSTPHSSGPNAPPVDRPPSVTRSATTPAIPTVQPSSSSEAIPTAAIPIDPAPMESAPPAAIPIEPTPTVSARQLVPAPSSSARSSGPSRATLDSTPSSPELQLKTIESFSTILEETYTALRKYDKLLLETQQKLLSAQTAPTPIQPETQDANSGPAQGAGDPRNPSADRSDPTLSNQPTAATTTATPTPAVRRCSPPSPATIPQIIIPTAPPPPLPVREQPHRIRTPNDSPSAPLAYRRIISPGDTTTTSHSHTSSLDARLSDPSPLSLPSTPSPNVPSPSALRAERLGGDLGRELSTEGMNGGGASRGAGAGSLGLQYASPATPSPFSANTVSRLWNQAVDRGREGEEGGERRGDGDGDDHGEERRS